MTILPQSNSLQELQRAFLALQSMTMQSVETAKARAVQRLPGVSGTGLVNTQTSGGNSGAVSDFDHDFSVQTIRVESIELDGEDGLPATDDDDDCAIVSVSDIPVLFKPLSPVYIAFPSTLSTIIWSLPGAFDEYLQYVWIDGEPNGAGRLEVSLGDKRVIFYNGTESIISIAMPLDEDPDPPENVGVPIASGSIAWVQERDDKLGMELVIFYDVSVTEVP